jgi:hypothetical protein
MLWLSWSGHSLGMLTNNTLDFSGHRTKDATQQEAHIPLEFLIFFLHGGLSNATFIFIVIYIFYAPQGDALQQGTEGMEYVVLHFASSEDVNDLYLKPPFCKVGIWN